MPHTGLGAVVVALPVELAYAGHSTAFECVLAQIHRLRHLSLVHGNPLLALYGDAGVDAFEFPVGFG
jgi:hypothetical protein